MSVLLEVAIRSERDVPGAEEGGADRMFLTGNEGLSPDLAATSAVLRVAQVPVRVMLRLNDSFTTNGGEFTRLVGLAEEYVALGAQGVAFGFLDADLEVDVATCRELAGRLPGVPWTFHHAIDSCLDSRRAWRDLLKLPGLDAVHASGSPRGLGVGYDDLLATAQGDERAAALMLPGTDLLPEQVPWLARAGIGQFHVGVQARPGASYKAYVDSGHVRSWRLLLDS
ncbi:copper homeostasis protein CutC [Nocardioides sp. JQ2195]|uniref:copper homeostasis protein CutC n=1 Tax=Nocardioides sp. JQ2195 TaxID=2592334 RepID=UPI00143E50E8|nr:copper homeostasis protein CutC [Nocardioides sp. JQ2195]QIX25727.1 copper homeostasis protein CutC [Nocardioides sp. JQ2195]